MYEPRKSKQMLQVEQEHGKPIEHIIIDALTHYGTIYRAAESLGIHPQTFYGWMIRLRIQVKKVPIIA